MHMNYIELTYLSELFCVVSRIRRQLRDSVGAVIAKNKG